VNLWDLIDARRAGTVVRKFPNLNALRKYTQEHGRIFPKRAAKDDGFLKDLLRKMVKASGQPTLVLSQGHPRGSVIYQR
jgi:hypothetical protein